MSDLNLSSLVTDSSGRVRFSGLKSGIDFESAVESIIAARRIPVDRIEASIEKNDTKITALRDLQSLMQNLQESLSKLYGKVSVDNTQDIFRAKSAFATASRSDGGTASQAANLIGITVGSAAQATSHEIEVLQIAKAQKIGSGTFSSTGSDLGTASGLGAGSIAGSFDINGKTIAVNATDSLADLRDRINNANTGTSATGVSASIVSVGTNQHILVITADKTGQAITLDNETGGVLADLGISGDGGATLTNQLQAAQTAKLHADGILDVGAYQSSLVANAADPLSSYGVIGGPHSFEVRDASGALLGNVAYNATDDLTTLAGNIDAIAGVSASVVSEGGQVRLEVTSDDGSAITLKNDSGTLLGDLEIAHPSLVIERSSNTINDLFAGITLSIFQAEPGTTVKIDVERDLSQMKDAIVGFADAYNALKTFINEQDLTDPETGDKSDEAGPLFNSTTLSDIEARLSNLLGQGAQGVGRDFTVLAQIGLKFVDNNTLSDPTQRDTLVIDDTTLDEALLNNFEDVRRLFSFDFSTSDPRVQLIGFTGATGYTSAGYTLNIGNVGSANDVSGAILDKAATLNDGVNSFGATTSGQFEINGTVITYDVTTDTVDSLVTQIRNAGIPGVSAVGRAASGGGFELSITSSQDPLTINNDTGDLLGTLGLTSQSFLVGSANIDGTADGADDGSATTSGKTITVTDASGAQGLKLFFTGQVDTGNIDIDFSVGLGTSMFFELDRILEENTGSLDAEINNLTEQNSAAQKRADTMLDRLDFQRTELLARFVRMESALASLNRVRDSITQITDAMFADR